MNMRSDVTRSDVTFWHVLCHIFAITSDIATIFGIQCDGIKVHILVKYHKDAARDYT